MVEAVHSTVADNVVLGGNIAATLAEGHSMIHQELERPDMVQLDSLDREQGTLGHLEGRKAQHRGELAVDRMVGGHLVDCICLPLLI